MARKTPSRGMILAMGVLMFLFIGTIYAWSILSAPFPTEFGWNSAQLGLNFTLVMCTFSFGGVIGSRITKRSNPRVTAVVGTVLCVAGYLLCSLIQANTLWLVYLAYGGLIGGGVGIAYNGILGAVLSWYPDKKGFASGVLLMGFGASTLIMGNIAALLFETPLGWRGTYILLGVATLIVMLFGNRWVIVAPPVPKTETAAASSARSYTTAEMLKKPAFYLLCMIIIFSNLSALGVVGHSRGIALEAGVPAGIIALIVGFQSVCNGLGRFSIGVVFDRFGRKVAILTDTGSFIVSCVLLLTALRTGSVVLTIVGLLLTGISYGAMITLISSFTADCFGPRDYASNFSIVTLAMIPASFGSALMGAMQTASGTYITSFYVFIAAAVGVIVLDLLLCRAAAKLQ